MKNICLQCDRTSANGHLLCQERYCATVLKPTILDYGEWLGDIEVTKLLTVLRSSAVYRAKRGETELLLKIAHDGLQERLKREAFYLKGMQFHPMLPVLLPAHEQADLASYPYGKTVFKGQTKYYCLYQHAEGDLLRDILSKNPQPWYQHAGWIAISLADTITYLHDTEKKERPTLHLSLSPEAIMIRFDPQNVPRPLLLDLGAVLAEPNVKSHWENSYTLPAYTAPELIGRDRRGGPASDVYGLGLVLYEMLAGRPAYEFRLRNDNDVQMAVARGAVVKLNRPDLKNIPAIVERAIHPEYRQRHQDALEFARDLLQNFPPVPREKKQGQTNWRRWAVVGGAALVITLLLVAAVMLGEAATLP